jgi:hypothetical protein
MCVLFIMINIDILVVWTVFYFLLNTQIFNVNFAESYLIFCVIYFNMIYITACGYLSLLGNYQIRLAG